MIPSRVKTGDLSTHFSRNELSCPCCSLCVVHPTLLASVETLRALISTYVDKDTPLHPTSGFRCHRHNESLNRRGFPASPYSQHLVGRAMDIRQARGISVDKMAELADQIPMVANGGIGVYDWGIHIDVRGYRARWKI